MQFLAARSLWTNLLALRYDMPSAISPAIWIIFLSGGRTWLVEFCKEKQSSFSPGSVSQTDLELKPLRLISIKETIFYKKQI